MLKLILSLVFLFSCSAFARGGSFGGGSRGGSFSGSRGSSFSSSRGSFGGSAATRSAPIVRPSYSSGASSAAASTTVVHNYGGGGYSGGNGFWTGMMLGHMFSGNSGTTVVQGSQPADYQAAPSGGGGFWSFLFWAVIIAVTIVICVMVFA